MEEDMDFMDVDEVFEENEGDYQSTENTGASDELVSPLEPEDVKETNELETECKPMADAIPKTEESQTQSQSKRSRSQSRRSRSRHRRSRSRNRSSHSKSHKRRSKTPNKSRSRRSKSRSRRSRRSRSKSKSRSKRSRSLSKRSIRSRSKSKNDSKPESKNDSKPNGPITEDKNTIGDCDNTECQDNIVLDEKKKEEKKTEKSTESKNSSTSRPKEKEITRRKSRHSRSRSRSRSKRSSKRSRRRRRKHSTSSSSSSDSSKSRSRSPRVRKSPDIKRRRISSPLSNRSRHVGAKDAPPPSTSIVIFGLPLTFSDTDLIKLIPEKEPALSPSSASVIKDKQSGISRGFGFMNYDSVDTATSALNFLQNQCEFVKSSVEINCNFSITHRAHSPTPNYYLGCKKTLDSLRHMHKVSQTAKK